MASPFQRSFYKSFYERHPFKHQMNKHSVSTDPATVCDFVLTELIDQFLGRTRASVPLDTINAVMTKLSTAFEKELKGRDIPVSMKLHHIQTVVKAVHVELCKKNSRNFIIVNLLVLQEKLCGTIVETRLKHVMKPRGMRGMKKFFCTIYIYIYSWVIQQLWDIQKRIHKRGHLTARVPGWQNTQRKPRRCFWRWSPSGWQQEIKNRKQNRRNISTSWSVNWQFNKAETAWEDFVIFWKPLLNLWKTLRIIIGERAPGMCSGTTRFMDIHCERWGEVSYTNTKSITDIRI